MITKLPRETLMRIDSMPEDEAVESYMPSRQKHSISQELFKHPDEPENTATKTELGKPKAKPSIFQTLVLILGVVGILVVGAVLTLIALSINIEIGR